MVDQSRSNMATKEELAAWTVTEKQSSGALCECISISISEKMITLKSNSSRALISSFVMKLVELDTGEEITCYFKFQKSKAGHATVKAESKFAILYRLTFGLNPRKRYSNARQLANHFKGEQFLVKYVIETTELKESYRKATSINPVVPIVTDEWTIKGKLLAITKPRKPLINRGNIEETSRKSRGNIEEKPRIANAGKPHSYLASPTISTASKSLLAIRQEGLRASASDDSNAVDSQPITMTPETKKQKAYVEYF